MRAAILRLTAFMVLVIFGIIRPTHVHAVEVLTVDVPLAMSKGRFASCTGQWFGSCSATLSDAVALIQNEAWQSTIPANVRVVRLQLQAGVHRIDKALSIDSWGVGRTHGIVLEFQGNDSGTIISGGVEIRAWLKPGQFSMPSRMAKAAVQTAWAVDVAQLGLDLDRLPQAKGFGLPARPVRTELFVDGLPQPTAGWPDLGYGEIFRPLGLNDSDQVTFAILGRSAASWQDEPDLVVEGFWRWDWAAQSYLVGQKYGEQNRLILLGAGSPYGIKAGQRVRIENALAELDRPGEWYLDRAAGMLYFYPERTWRGTGAELSVAEGLIRVLGSEKVHFKKLRLEKARGDAVVVRNSSEVLLEGVEIRNVGNRGLVIEQSTRSGIRHGLIERTGQGGVVLSGGDRQLLVAANNFVEGSTIRQFSRLIKTIAPAVDLYGVGQRVSGNVISGGPQMAIQFAGNDHLISGNEIFDVVTETSDAGAIYVGRDFTSYGTTIENNFLHDIQPFSKKFDTKGIYFDDQASGVSVRKNIFARVQQPVFIGGGRDISVVENIFYFSSPAVHLDARGVEGQRLSTLDPKGTLQKRLDSVPYQSALYASRYPNLPRIREDDFGRPKYNVFSRNVVVGGQVASISERAQGGVFLDGNIQAGEEIFSTQGPTSSKRLRRDDFVLKKQ